MVIGTLLSHVRRQLGNLHLFLEVLLEARVHDLALRWFETISHMCDGTFKIRETEVYQVLVYKVGNGQLFHTSIRNFELVGILSCIIQKPRLPCISRLLVECEDDRVIRHRVHIKLYREILNLFEILTSFGTCGSTKTLVVFDFPPSFTITIPGSKCRVCIERFGIRTLGRLDDWGHHRNHKVEIEETRPKIMDHV